MTALEIITPSYAPDYELCRDLVVSIRAHGPGDVRHRIIVPDRDLALFRSLEDDRTVIQRVSDVLPRGLHRVPRLNLWLNLRAPWPPVRGWIAQQIVKLAACAASTAAHALIVDSDVVFVRGFDLDAYLVDGAAPLYRMPDAVDARLPQHLIWDDVAHRMLGVPPRTDATRPDYICWPCLWQPAIARDLLRRVEEVTGRRWWTAVGRELRFSEMVLYGVYVDTVLAPATPTTTSMHCVPHSDEVALDDAALARFLARLTPDDLAVMISAKSGTSVGLRRERLRPLVPGL